VTSFVEDCICSSVAETSNRNAQKKAQTTENVNKYPQITARLNQQGLIAFANTLIAFVNILIFTWT